VWEVNLFLIEGIIRDDGSEVDVQSESPEKRYEVRQQAPNEQLAKRMDNMDRNQIFLEYKEKEGKEYNENVLKNITTLKEKKIEIKETSEECQRTKDQIERIKALIQQKQETKNQDVTLKGRKLLTFYCRKYNKELLMKKNINTLRN